MSSNVPAVDPQVVHGSSEPTAVPNWALLSRVLREPGHAATVFFAVLRGRLYTWWAQAFRPRVQIGQGLRIYGRLDIRGPGTVVLGDGVQIYGRVTPWTNAPDARIEVGDDTKLDGTRISCVTRVRIGRECLIANCRILDTSFHAVRRDAHSATMPILEGPVEVGDNVWISPDAGLLPGTRIGSNSVVAMAAICKGEFPEGVMILGNPARIAGRIG